MSEPNITYVVTIGPEGRDEEALYLINSIRKFDEEAKIVSFLAKSEKKEVDAGILDKIEDKTILIQGNMPNKEYPLSASHQALIEAGRASEDDYLLSIDTDTILLDKIRIHKTSDADLFVKPADLGFLHWQTKESQEKWEKLSKKVGIDTPKLDQLTSTVDKRKMREYYNGGFILTRNKNFPERWKKVSEQIYEETNAFFSEQIALAFLSQEYRTEKLDERYNLPLPMRFTIPGDTKVLHYHHLGYYHFFKLRNKKWIWEKLEGTGLIEKYKQEKNQKGFYKNVAKSYLNSTQASFYYYKEFISK